MAISEKTRKILWGRSGNRCAICRRELVMDANDLDDESVLGDECHIVAHQSTGPRGDSPLSLRERDNYENLILLCKVHHKLTDDQPNTFTVERLKDRKRRHETWVRETLKSNQKAHQTASEPFVAYRIETGKQLISALAGSDAGLFDNDQLENEHEVGLVGSFLQSAQDYLDLWDDLESRARVHAQLELDRDIRELEENGFLVYGCQRKERYKIGKSVIDDWRVAYLLVVRKSNPITAKKEERIENLLGTKSPPSSEFSSFVLIKQE